jgi:Skp family chaperone for outer membrane proteins
MKRLTACVTVGAALLGMAMVGSCWAAAAPSWGFLDMDRGVAAYYRVLKDLNDQFQQFQMEQERQLREQHTTRLLFDEERQQYLDLSHMGAPTEARGKRLAELRMLSDERERRLFELRKNEERSEDEQAEYGPLNQLYERRMEDLTALQADLQQSRLAKYEELTKLVTESIDAVVKAVAEEQKLGLVLRKEVVLFGGLDITEDVLARLNAGGEETTEPPTEEQ